MQKNQMRVLFFLPREQREVRVKMNHLLLTRTRKLFANKFASLTTDMITIMISGNGEGKQGRGTKARWGGPEGWEAPNGRFFLSTSLGGLLVELWWCFSCARDLKCARLWRKKEKKSEILGSLAGRAVRVRGESTKAKNFHSNQKVITITITGE